MNFDCDFLCKPYLQCSLSATIKNGKHRENDSLSTYYFIDVRDLNTLEAHRLYLYSETTGKIITDAVKPLDIDDILCSCAFSPTVNKLVGHFDSFVKLKSLNLVNCEQKGTLQEWVSPLEDKVIIDSSLFYLEYSYKENNYYKFLFKLKGVASEYNILTGFCKCSDINVDKVIINGVSLNEGVINEYAMIDIKRQSVRGMGDGIDKILLLSIGGFVDIRIYNNCMWSLCAQGISLQSQEKHYRLFNEEEYNTCLRRLFMKTIQ